MQNGNSLLDEYDRRLRGRLRELTARHPQAEIARKCGSSKANVHRWLGGNRIPASLCAAVIENLGVDAGWLMVGRGVLPGKGQDDATAGAPGVQGLIDLVNAMNAAARLNLGALRDKHHLKVARELSDALARHEQTRSALAGLCRGVLRRVLDDWHQAVAGLKGEQCAALRESARQLLRLCDDEPLALEAASLEAHTEAHFGHESRALELQRRAVTLTLLRPGGLDDEAVSRINMLIAMLETHGRLREALRLARATLELVRDNDRVQPARRSILYMNVGSQAMDLGELEDALRALRLAVQAAPPGSRTRDFAVVFWMLAQYWAGACDFAQAQRTGSPWWARAEFLLLMALWQEDAPSLRAALAEYRAGLAETSADPNTESITARWCLRALRRPHHGLAAGARRDLLARQPEQGDLPADRFAVRVFEAQVAWLSRNTRHCARVVAQAGELLDSMGQDDPVLLPRALFHRLVWRLSESRMGARHGAAAEFFRQWTARGYARLAGVVT
ncbi:MAG: hypothetical protein HS108_01475 [Planctomycetes bacterium]|nr:hypothetical protein [Planctomycetota bacterium]MCL4731435.1 hypothetical protein [Planctomycetota bacterium]